MPEPLLVLASTSPRRASILRALGVPFRVAVSGADETLREGEDAVSAALRLARAKAAAVRGETLPVLTADTLVTCEGRILGKPAGEDEASAMLRMLSGRVHDVVTGLCLVAGGGVYADVERTAVSFAELTEAEIGWYVATGEPLDKAGAYHVDGRGAVFISSIAGSPSNVAGLPVRLLLRLARQARVDLGLPPVGNR